MIKHFELLSEIVDQLGCVTFSTISNVSRISNTKFEHENVQVEINQVGSRVNFDVVGKLSLRSETVNLDSVAVKRAATIIINNIDETRIKINKLAVAGDA